MKTGIKEATYVSVWDGNCIEKVCKVNMNTKEVFDIEQSNYTPDGIYEGEYVEIDGQKYEVYLEDEADADDYWRE